MGRGSSLLVGVSGGVDSMLLLHLLHELAPAWEWRLEVAHFNHRLRGRASNADERLVRETAARLGLECRLGGEDVQACARERGISIEMAARECRHRFLAESARARGIRTLVLAHHADDQVEGFFVRLLRGSGLEGLTGMEASARSPVDRRLRLVRPLLGCLRQEIVEEAERRGLRWREDATNAGREPIRNRIRHELLPLLREQYQPAIVPVVLRTMEMLRGEAELLARLTDAQPEGAGSGAFFEQPVAWQRRRIQAQLRALGHTVAFELVERLRRFPGKAWAVDATTRLALGREGTLRQCEPAGAGFRQDHLALELDRLQGEVRFGGRRIGWRVRRVRRSTDWRCWRPVDGEVFDAERVGAPVRLRFWQPGDRFRPSGMPCEAKLQDLLVSAKVPRAERHQRLVAETATGEIFWVEGLRIGEVFKVTPATRRLLVWRVSNPGGERPKRPQRLERVSRS